MLASKLRVLAHRIALVKDYPGILKGVLPDASDRKFGLLQPFVIVIVLHGTRFRADIVLGYGYEGCKPTGPEPGYGDSAIGYGHGGQCRGDPSGVNRSVGAKGAGRDWYGRRGSAELVGLV